MDPIEALKIIHVIARNPWHCSEFAFRDIDKLVRDAIGQPNDPIVPAEEYHGSAWAWAEAETMTSDRDLIMQQARALSLADLKSLVEEREA